MKFIYNNLSQLQINKKSIFFCGVFFVLFLGFSAFTVLKKGFFERGLAEKIPNSSNNDHFLAMHKTLPTGSKVLVRNTSNGRTLVVKIIGQMPNIGVNDKLVIKISENAYNRLLAQGKRFGVELTDAPIDADFKDKPEEEPTEKPEEKEIVKKDKKQDKKLDEKEETPEMLKNATTHRVKLNDNLYKIAKKYNVSVKTIKELNNLKDNSLYEGQILKLRKK